jgi:hypothetical protein
MEEKAMSDENAIVKVGKVENVFLAARNSREMASSQKQLEDWLGTKRNSVQVEYNELCAAIRHAESCKWNTKALVSARSKARGRFVYYDKLLKATQAGYIIIPWMSYDAFAIRVVREEAKLLSSRNDYSYPSAPEQPSDVASAGEGRYVSTKSDSYPDNSIRKDKQGQEINVYETNTTTEFKDVEFPVLAAKPTLMSAAANAMALKIFDEIGIAPNRRGRDPFIVGTVKGPKGPQIFLIAWYLDTRAL